MIVESSFSVRHCPQQESSYSLIVAALLSRGWLHRLTEAATQPCGVCRVTAHHPLTLPYTSDSLYNPRSRYLHTPLERLRSTIPPLFFIFQPWYGPPPSTPSVPSFQPQAGRTLYFTLPVSAHLIFFTSKLFLGHSQHPGQPYFSPDRCPSSRRDGSFHGARTGVFLMVGGKGEEELNQEPSQGYH